MWTFADKLKVIPSDVDDEGLKKVYQGALQYRWNKEARDAYIFQV